MLRLSQCLLGCAFVAVAFVPPAAAQIHPPDQSAPTQQQPSSSAVPTLRAGTQLVIVDVVVTDKSQKPVHGLKVSDFSLTEENVPQSIKHFEEHAALTPADATKFPTLPKMPPGVFTNYVPEPVNGAVNLSYFSTL